MTILRYLLAGRDRNPPSPLDVDISVQDSPTSGIGLMVTGRVANEVESTGT
ncbi:hypothetical protein [Echinicola soli]|uniref:hypothetical protein n=1 Tax=Echinicola soli TaxID=2591634 RepID=UPI00143D43B8|nr:hypothetical protein [Echinicola soli]